MGLTFVEQCYKEAMRMYAPATIVHRVAAKDTEVNGVFFPKGTAIGVCIHSMHFDEKHWENPTVYDPDRFSLDSSKKRPFTHICLLVMDQEDVQDNGYQYSRQRRCWQSSCSNLKFPLPMITRR